MLPPPCLSAWWLKRAMMCCSDVDIATQVKKRESMYVSSVHAYAGSTVGTGAVASARGHNQVAYLSSLEAAQKQMAADAASSPVTVRHPHAVSP